MPRNLLLIIATLQFAMAAMPLAAADTCVDLPGGSGCALPEDPALTARSVTAQAILGSCPGGPVAGTWTILGPTVGHGAIAAGPSTTVDLSPVGRADGTWTINFQVVTTPGCVVAIRLALALSDGSTCMSPVDNGLPDPVFRHWGTMMWIVNAHRTCESLFTSPTTVSVSSPSGGVEAPVIYLPPQPPLLAVPGPAGAVRVFVPA